MFRRRRSGWKTGGKRTHEGSLGGNGKEDEDDDDGDDGNGGKGCKRDLPTEV